MHFMVVKSFYFYFLPARFYVYSCRQKEAKQWTNSRTFFETQCILVAVWHNYLDYCASLMQLLLAQKELVQKTTSTPCLKKSSTLHLAP